MYFFNLFFKKVLSNFIFFSKIQLQTKSEILEKSLSQIIKEFEIERFNLIEKCKLELESSKTELEKVKKMLELRNKEMNKVKKLAKNILEQRSDIERFFLDSLDYVKQQIITNRFKINILFFNQNN